MARICQPSLGSFGFSTWKKKTFKVGKSPFKVGKSPFKVGTFEDDGFPNFYCLVGYDMLSFLQKYLLIVFVALAYLMNLNQDIYSSWWVKRYVL